METNLHPCSGYHRLFDNSPRTDIPCGDIIGWSSETARLTDKRVSGAPIRLGDMATVGTCSTRVTGINQNQRHSCQYCFVRHKLTELRKSPVGQSRPLPPPSRNPLANPRQVFQADRACGALGGCHDCFANAVIHVFLVAGLFTFELVEFPLRRTRAVALQVAAAVRKRAALLLNRLSRVGHPIGIDGEVHNAQVNPEGIHPSRLFFAGHITDREDVPFPSDQAQIDFPLAIGEQAALMCSTDKRDLLPTAGRPERDGVIVHKPKDPIIEGLRCRWTKPPLDFLVELVGVGNLSNAAHNHLGRQWKFLTTQVVTQVMQAILPKRLLLPGQVRDPIARRIRRLQGLTQRSLLFRCRQQLELRNQFHTLKYRGFSETHQEGRRPFLPRLKARVSWPKNL